MLASYVRLLKVTLALTLFLPLLATVVSQAAQEQVPSYWAVVALALGATSWFLGRQLSRFVPALGDHAERQAAYLDALPPRLLGLAIVASAAASLLLELATIRWLGSEWVVFAFYKNFVLLACFAGLGLGYALARSGSIPLLLVIPLMVYQLAFLLALRHGLPAWCLQSLMATPIQEQLNMGFAVSRGALSTAAVYALLAAVLLLTALAFIPVGQLCGRLLDRAERLRGYGLNLLGSLAGVGLMTLASFLWTPPTLWFALPFALLLPFLQYDRRALVCGGLAVVAAVAVLDWPISFGWERIYTPYQVLARGPGEDRLMLICAAGTYYQRVHDLSAAAQRAYPARRTLAAYYELPFSLRGAGALDVAVVGAGTGNDVAAALRRGAGRVDAIEIDPAILALGALYHPERPYADRRVAQVVDDARTFLRRTDRSYDLIVYGMLDSHTLLSHASSVRLDSFVYTVEGLRDARARLRAGGVVSLSFSVLSRELGRKIFLMMQAAFEGAPPACIYSRYDGSVVFAQARDGGLRADPELLRDTGFQDCSALYADPAVLADVSTDDWPFFYMPRRVYPVSYLWMVGLTLALSAGLFFGFTEQRPRLGDAAFLFMGAGFMLVETKAITELGLAFGNTWLVIGVVIAAVLLMAFLANGLVKALGVTNPVMPLVLVLLSLGAGLAYARAGGGPASALGQVTALVMLTCPMFFSGLAFSALLTKPGDLSGALAMNLFGAMLGGLLEYNSMYFGFQALYWIAMALYGAALLATLTKGRAAA